MTTNIKTSNMKAIKLLQKSLKANLNLAEQYNEEAEFALFKKNEEEFDRKKKTANRFTENAKECEEAIEEINELIKNK